MNLIQYLTDYLKSREFLFNPHRKRLGQIKRKICLRNTIGKILEHLLPSTLKKVTDRFGSTEFEENYTKCVHTEKYATYRKRSKDFMKTKKNYADVKQSSIRRF